MHLPEDYSIIECVHMENTTKRRNRYDITAEILKTARNGKVKTRIMYRARLNGAQVNEYLALLVNKGLLKPFTVEQKKVRRILYRTTEEGMKLLKNLELIAEIWLSF